MKEQIEFTEFLEIEKKLEITIGKIIEVEEVPKAKKLLKLTVDFGEETTRSVITNIKTQLGDISILENKEMLFVTNLKPTTIMGVESTAMILPGSQLEVDGSIISTNGDAGVIIL